MEGGLLTPARQDRPRQAVLEARGLVVRTDARTLLSEVSLSLAPGELVALIGPSGAGKTTLLGALSGAGPLHGGAVALHASGEQQRYGIGYVPSDDPLHGQLSVREELLFAAALRGPAGLSVEVLEATVAAVLEELSLTERADQRIASLSKGERRRVSLAVELVGQPDVLLLDEPGSGLDAGLERRLMALLRRLADQGRAILAATHATASLRLCDRVAVMGRGGVLQFVGGVEEMLAHFGVDSVDAVYERLEDLADTAAASPESTSGRGSELPPERPLPLGPAPGFGRQLAIMAERGALCRLRDARGLALLIGQAPIIGLAIALVLPQGSVSDPTLGPYYGVLMAFLLLTASIWLGTISACREIVAEVDTVRRETAVGLRIDVYMVAKCLTLFPVVILQTGLLGLVVVTIQRVPQGALMIVVACLVCGLAAACFGLWLSAWARNSDIAVGSTPLIMIPQLLLAGALIPVSAMPLPFRYISDALVGRWAFDAIGSALGLGTRLGSSLSAVTGLEPTSFAPTPGSPIALMAGLGLLGLVFAARALIVRIRVL
ncbi:MAG TPA: ATP-binding cassette domain-containing protein [Solirubrobacteraceae bacterium]|nr:ATP-binding cassette domain-containing protein [Solirubrobacteraceae bacterium]